MVSSNNKMRHKIKKMRTVTFYTLSHKNNETPSCCVCNKSINIGDEYFYNKYKHYTYNRIYCVDCTKEKNLLVR
jgi:hypothetical protein